MNQTYNIHFSLSQIETLFPFFIVFDEQMEIRQVGKSLRKIATHHLTGNLFEVIEFSRPHIDKPDFESLKQFMQQVIILNLKQENIVALRGQLLFLPEQNEMVFLGSPWFHSIEDLKKHHLVLSDFAIHDSIIDLLHVLKTQEIVYGDMHNLYNTVKKQKDELYRLSLIVEETLNPVIITDAKGDIEWVNKAFEKLTGYSIAEIKSLRPGMILQGEGTSQETVLYLRERIRNGEPFQCEILNYKKDKTPYWIAIIGQPVFDKKGNLINFFAIEENITDRKQAEQKLKNSEEKYRSIIENMELGLLEVDNQGNIIRAYQRFCELVGYQADELLGVNALSLFVPKEYQAILSQQSIDRQKGQAGTYEIPLVHKNGNFIWVLISGAPIYGESGEIKGSIGIHYNLTERKILEEKLALAKQVAEDARRTEQQFLANMSHEIRTPLNAIIGMSHLLYDTRPNPEQKEYIDILNNSANFLHSLISNILDMAKIEAGKIELNHRPFDLVGIIRALQKTFQMKLEGREIEVDAMIDSRINGFYVGDETMIHQILMNLLGNADKFTESGRISILIRQLKKEEEKIWIEFKIEDTGIGIADDQLPLIFQKFKQIQDENGQKYKGTGLGLSIVKELIDLQGGIISVQSKKGEGTAFTFVLPLEKAAEEEDKRLHNTQIDTSHGSDFTGVKILVVEDNIMNRKYLGSLLDKKKIIWDIAVDGLEALRKSAVKKYDMILMDIQMPNMNGYEATLGIRNTQNINSKTPIIALTASAMLDQKNKAFDVGMDDYISKPFTPQQLFDKIALNLKTAMGHLAKNGEISLFEYDKALDVAYLNMLYENDYEYAFNMFDTFQVEILPEFETMLILANTHNTTELRRVVHQIKPTCAMVGLTEIERDLFLLENLLLQNTLSPERMYREVSNICEKMQEKKDILQRQHAALRAILNT